MYGIEPPDPTPIILLAIFGVVALVFSVVSFVVWATSHIRIEWVA